MKKLKKIDLRLEKEIISELNNIDQHEVKGGTNITSGVMVACQTVDQCFTHTINTCVPQTNTCVPQTTLVCYPQDRTNNCISIGYGINQQTQCVTPYLTTQCGGI